MRKWIIALLAVAAVAAIACVQARRGSLRSEFESDARAQIGRAAAARVITESDLAPLPPPVQRYLRYVGVVGKPAVVNFHATFDGEFARNREAALRPIQAEQYSFYDPAGRLF